MKTRDINKTLDMPRGVQAPTVKITNLIEFMTNRKTKKLWITPAPANEIIPLSTFHYQYFQNPMISEKYGVLFRDEETTRLDALRVGFVRINYEVNGGRLTGETMRWDRTLRKLIDAFVLTNAEEIDLVRFHLLDRSGQAIQVGAVSLMDLRDAGKEINRWNLGSWNNFRVTKL